MNIPKINQNNLIVSDYHFVWSDQFQFLRAVDDDDDDDYCNINNIDNNTSKRTNNTNT